MLTPKLKLFLDASVKIAGSASPTGGSAFILEVCQKGLFQAVTSKLVLRETERNIINKLDEKTLTGFYKCLKALSLEIQPPATTSNRYQDIIAPKDAHVLASALESQSDYLITLDRKHFFTPKIQQAKLSIKIITPKDFIQGR